MINSTPRTVTNTIWAIVYLVDELEEGTLNKIVWDTVNTQLYKLTADMKLLIEDAKEKIDKHLHNKPTAVNITNSARQIQAHSHSYANALINPSHMQNWG